jgi:hypothetical protein
MLGLAELQLTRMIAGNIGKVMHMTPARLLTLVNRAEVCTKQGI